jgi:GH24 family phage-related lysozyme (muramidase)
MQFSQEAIDLVKEYEGFRAKPYKCLAGQNTIGYGHRLSHSIIPIAIINAVY